MMKHNEPNPLAVFNMRRMDFCPPHFETITFDLRSTEKAISDWIYENTEGRFFLGDVVKVVPEESGRPRWSAQRQMSKCVGFENHSEASYFTLMMDQFNKIADFG
jgi:hypothetical protein